MVHLIIKKYSTLSVELEELAPESSIISEYIISKLSFLGHFGTGEVGHPILDLDEGDSCLLCDKSLSLSATIICISSSRHFLYSRLNDVASKNLSLKRGSTIVAIDKSLFSSTPANLVFNDFIISPFMVRIP